MKEALTFDDVLLVPQLSSILPKDVIRKYVEFLDIDRPLYPDHTAMKELVKSAEILEETEKIVGSLE